MTSDLATPALPAVSALPALPAAPPAVAVHGLSRRFGAKAALDDVTLTVPRGVVFGLVGANGAGKTTLLRHVLGLLRAETGTVRVFGIDPVANPPAALARIGCLSEENDLPGWMRVGELLAYCRAFRPAWDDALAERLRRDFELDGRATVRSLSKGQRARAGLVAALAHRPDLLVLDEPSSGLDPMVRRDILGAVVRTVADEGRTVLFSSHLLDEVERVADRLAMIHEGAIALCGPVEDILAGHRWLALRLPAAAARPPELAGALAWEGGGTDWAVLVAGGEEQLAAAGQLGTVLSARPATLDEIFMARAAARRGA